MGEKKTAVLLMNLGGPDSLDAIQPFLYNLFCDKEIIKLSRSFLLQKFIAKRISTSRAKKVIPRYESIGGKSPINEITRAQADALQVRLNEGAGSERFIVEPAMRYWRPFTKDVIDKISGAGCSEIIALTLYPHYSKATTGSSVNELKHVLKKAGKEFDIKYIENFATHEGYINALVRRIEDGLSKFEESGRAHVLFSAHSMPVEFIEKGDPYLNEVKATISAVLKKIEIENHHLAFQSRSGPVKWLEPPTDKTIEKLAAEGVKDLLLVPISFVSDHIETLFEIDILFKDLANEHGVENFIRADSFNDSADFIDVLKDLVESSLNSQIRGA